MLSFDMFIENIGCQLIFENNFNEDMDMYSCTYFMKYVNWQLEYPILNFKFVMGFFFSF